MNTITDKEMASILVVYKYKSFLKSLFPRALSWTTVVFNIYHNPLRLPFSPPLDGSGPEMLGKKYNFRLTVTLLFPEHCY